MSGQDEAYAALGDMGAMKRLRSQGAGRRPSMGGFVFGVWPSDVDDLKREINPSMVTTDAAVKSCAALSAQELAGWTEFFKSWQGFFQESTPLMFGAGPKYDEAQRYKGQLSGWQQQLRGKCTLVGPDVKDPDEDGSGLASAVKFGAVAVVAVAIVYGIRTVIK